MNTVTIIDHRSFLEKLRSRIFHNHKRCQKEKTLLELYQKCQLNFFTNCLEMYSANITRLQTDFFDNFDKYICKNCRKRYSCSCNTNVDPSEEEALHWCFNCKQVTIFDNDQLDIDSYRSTCLRCGFSEIY